MKARRVFLASGGTILTELHEDRCWHSEEVSGEDLPDRRGAGRGGLVMRAVAIVFLLALLALPAHAEESRHYWPVSTRDLATTSRTHVEVRGTVTYRAKEDDGDVHLRICDAGLCIVAECIPELPAPCVGVRKGDTVTVRGIARYDRKHGWGEVHPVLELRRER